MPPQPEDAIKEAIAAAVKTMQMSGLSPGRSGNISVRWKGGMLITASGIHPHEMDPATDVVFVDAGGMIPAPLESLADSRPLTPTLSREGRGRNSVPSSLARERQDERARLRARSGLKRSAALGITAPEEKAPSSEWRFHKVIYETRPDIGGVVHCHSRFATALACAHRSIPAFHYMVAKAGGVDIPLVPYATYGTAELAALAAAALTSRNACLLANHGQIAIGETLEDAFELAGEVEVLAAQYVTARSLGEPILLENEEMTRVVEKFKTYGKGTKQPKKRRDANKP